MADLQDTGAEAPMNQDTVKKLRRAKRLTARLERIAFLKARTDNDVETATLEKEEERRKAELHYLSTTLEARLEA